MAAAAIKAPPAPAPQPPRPANHFLRSTNGSSDSENQQQNGDRDEQKNMSPSPEKDTAAESADSKSTDQPVNPKKRSSSDAVEYPRRRATIAEIGGSVPIVQRKRMCEVCRSRKSRCDGTRPKCRLCTELNAECIYREPGIKLDAGDKLILEHLNRIEGMLHSGLVSQASHLALSSTSPAASNGTNMSNDDMMAKGPNMVSAVPGALTVVGLGSWVSPPTSISTMPKVHTTPALHLLQWPLIRDLVSRPYDPQNLLQLEMSREPLRMGSTMSLDLANTATYVQSFFERVNVWYACVNPYNWTRYYRTALSQGFREGPESCIVLLVLALGSASNSGSISCIPPDKEPPGMPYFAAAWGLLPSLMMRNSVLSAQCMILASAYLFYLVRPLEAWTLLSNISIKLQLLLGSPGRIPPQSKELSFRVYWNALLFESDLLAELDLPHSGIVQFEETAELPGGFEEEDDEEPAGRDELWYFLSEIALRRLLNRVSHMIYQKDSPLSIAALEPIVAELDFQLTQWYESLPLPVQFPHTRTPLANPVQTVLRHRYYACRTIIYRPYILAVFENEQLAMDPTVAENCRRCLDACMRQLEHITTHHAGHLPYLWQGALSMVSQTLLVMGATMSPALSSLLYPPSQMDIIISDVVIEVERYAHLAPSLRLSAEIIREAEDRRQMYLRSSGLRA
ncbi:hypothetical protein AJ80_04609 [Polytolypa hystricis UAMH7299]|uniref:Zn(2)-C6 fungal-type domain-containing protein n=1 Tax=Polytolypa hystricis (strain UAMH7299) TaxID=1447883 RepID=A0A2B7YAP3_POLH7|nr:hypothetical protein AJ80_04609 [Polytolypa hystricis UAMH7299]